MSGGTYGSHLYHVLECAEEIARRHADDPAIVAFAADMTRMGEALRAVDYADSGDTSWTAELYALLATFRGPRDPGAAELSAASTLRRQLAEARITADTADRGMDFRCDGRDVLALLTAYDAARGAASTPTSG